jgi:hypothetical protein
MCDRQDSIEFSIDRVWIHAFRNWRLVSQQQVRFYPSRKESCLTYSHAWGTDLQRPEPNLRGSAAGRQRPNLETSSDCDQPHHQSGALPPIKLLEGLSMPLGWRLQWPSPAGAGLQSAAAISGVTWELRQAMRGRCLLPALLT